MANFLAVGRGQVQPANIGRNFLAGVQAGQQQDFNRSRTRRIEQDAMQAARAEIAKTYLAADTPEKWEQATDYLAQQGLLPQGQRPSFEERELHLAPMQETLRNWQMQEQELGLRGFNAETSRMNAETARSRATAPSARKMIKGADGYNYYADTGERVLPGVRAKEKDGMTVYGPDGSPIMTTGDPEKVRKLTENQSKFALFGSMMDRTMPVIDDLETKFDPSNVGDALADRAGFWGNYAKSDEYQRYSAAGRAWAEGVLRLQTGAAATEPEIRRVFETYFAQPGDSPETVQYKRELRDAYGESIGVASGGLVRPGAGGDKPGAPASVQSLSDEDLMRMLEGGQ